jgi:hypothetical protein
MPQWMQDPAARRKHLDLLLAKYMDEDRTQEIHLMELYHCLTKGWYDKHDALPLTEKEILMFSVGFAFEQVYLRNEDKPNPPPKRELFGIHMSPDHEAYPGREEDFKTTAMWKGDDGSPRRGWPAAWLYQFSMYGLSQVLPADTDVNSDWESLVPEDIFYDVAILYLNAARDFEVITLKFTKDEVLQAAYTALDRKAIYERYTDTPPEPFKFNEDYECEHCRYLLRCRAAQTANTTVRRKAAKAKELAE